MVLFLKALAVGFIIAVPLGPASVLCFRRVLTGSRMVGLLTIAGTALADMIYGLAAAAGLKFVTRTLLSHREALHVFGGFFLIYFGTRMIRAHPVADDRDDGPQDLWHVFLSSFLLMIANPFIVISFFGVFAALDVSTGHESAGDILGLGPGIFLGSAAWWLVYKVAAARFGEQLRRNGIRVIDIAAGCLICVFGFWQLGEFAFAR